MYHYVRDLAASDYPRIKGMELSVFREQVRELSQEYEMATLESALAFLDGAYVPRRDLCLLTFDDGLREHYTDVAPFLAEQHLSGVFFLITGSLENARVAPVHMNHFLMASMEFSKYRDLLWTKIASVDPRGVPNCDGETARKAYSWDSDEVARFKYVFNFLLDAEVRDRAVKLLFEEEIGPEAEFSAELYVTWEEARRMQQWGMTIGGHTHEHRPLSALGESALREDLKECTGLLKKHLQPQSLWPFSYPYGRRESFTPDSVAALRELGYACAFSSESGANGAGEDRFALRRVDCKRAGAGRTSRSITVNA
jgi:peptidoglycan/xylan/chitin deacetylase (PgdA/CDA1 family)